MITRPEDREPKKVTASAEPVEKKPIAVPDVAPVHAAKEALGAAGVNVIDKHAFEKKHFLMMGGCVVFMTVALIISGITGSNRERTIKSLDREINLTESNIRMYNETYNDRTEAAAKQSMPGLDQEQLARDSDIIQGTLANILEWEGGGLGATRSSVMNIYHLNEPGTGDDPSGILATFYPDAAYASRFDSVTIYPMKQAGGSGQYACEVSWTMTLEDGTQSQRQAMFLCTVVGEVLSNLEAWAVH